MARAGALQLLGNVGSALKEVQAAYRLYSVIGDARGRAIALQNLGVNFFYARDYERANHYFDLSLEADPDDPSIQIATLGNRGQSLRAQGNAKAAERAFMQTIQLARKLKSPLLEARTMGMLADAQLRAGEIGAAKETIARGLAMAPPGGSEEWKPELYRVAASAALQQHLVDEATRFIEKALSIKTSSSTLLRDEHETAYEIYKARGDEGRALQHLEQFKTLDDQARNVAASTSAALMAAQFDYANQNLKIAELHRGEAQRDAVIARNRQQMLLGLLVATGAVILLLLVIQVALRRSRNRIAAIADDLSVSNADLERALAARTEFLATTSHEIRTPLNGILGMTQVLLADRGLDGGVRTKIELMHGAGETMRALVDDLLDLAKMTTGELTITRAPMNLPALLRETVQVWESQAQAQGLGIALEMEGLPDRICQDEVRLRQIVFNLISNAIKFTDRGVIRVVARATEQQRLRIEVIDTGIGIPADRLEEIFESFRQVDSGRTRRHSGTGLGLAICRSLAQAMGGSVGVSSVVGAGATFTIDLPLEPVAGEAADHPASAGAAATLAEARVLLVEANLLTQSILRAVLTPQVRSFTGVTSLEDARATLSGDAIDLLLIDSGVLERRVEAAADIARFAGRTVLLWPQPDEEIRAAARSLGIEHILATPLTPAELVAQLKGLYAPANRSEEMAA